MDPIISVDDSGNGTVIVYHYGKTWTISVVGWIGYRLPDWPSDNPMNRIAQLELNRLRDKDWARGEMV